MYRNVECAWSSPRGPPADCSATARRPGPRRCCDSSAPSRRSPGPVPGPSVAAAPDTAFNTLSCFTTAVFWKNRKAWRGTLGKIQQSHLEERVQGGF